MSDEIVLPPIDVTDAERMAAKEWCGMIQKSRLMDGLVEVDSNFRCRERQLRASTARVIALERALREILEVVSDEKGWGTHRRMEGSELYAEMSTATDNARAALNDK